MAETREERRARRADTPEPQWSGWAVIATPQGWKHVRVLLPESVVEAHRVADIEPPNTRAIMSAKIERDLASDRLVDRRGWEPRKRT